MAKATDDERKVYTQKISLYRENVQTILGQEKDALVTVSPESIGYPLKQIELSESMLNMASNYFVMNGISVSILGQKNEEALNEGRKALYKSIIYLEKVVGNVIDAPFSDYEQKLRLIESMSPAQRYLFIRKLGLTVALTKDAYGENSKWRWAFVDLEGRFAAVAKNIINLRDYFINSDPRSQHYEPTMFHLRLAKELMAQAADGYRQRYELSTNRVDDFKLGITFLSALKNLNILTGDRIEAETIKKKLEAWSAKLTSDMAKQVIRR
jgi:hypothetical protein